jgi:hypothetical protein
MSKVPRIARFGNLARGPSTRASERHRFVDPVTPRRIGVIPELNKDERLAALGAHRTGSPLVQYSQLQPGQAPHFQARLMPGVDRLTHCLHSTNFMELEKIGDFSIAQCPDVGQPPVP